MLSSTLELVNVVNHRGPGVDARHQGAASRAGGDADLLIRLTPPTDNRGDDHRPHNRENQFKLVARWRETTNRNCDSSSRGGAPGFKFAQESMENVET